MTGKELIIYILENDLLDENVIKDDGVPIFLLSLYDAAEKFDVGPMTVRTWAALGKLDWGVMDGRLYIYENAKDPRN